jgi:putative transposase
MRTYSDELKASLVERMLLSKNASVPALSREMGIARDTLYGWRRQAQRERGLAILPAGATERWGTTEKFAMVVETAMLNEMELGEYCRKRGLYPEQLRAWRTSCEQANADKAVIQRPGDMRADKRRIQALERELQRQEKALAEAAARVVLRKKSPGDLGGGRARMISALDRPQRVTLIEEARQAGARLAGACAELGIDVRTSQRWTQGNELKGDGRPDAVRPPPANKLSAEERARVLAICHEPLYASLPPGQIVPRLADQGEYLASESSFYRILRAADEQRHRGRSRAPRPPAEPPRLVARASNEVWTWDISWLTGPVKGLFFYLYLIVDLYSRKGGVRMRVR